MNRMVTTNTLFKAKLLPDNKSDLKMVRKQSWKTFDKMGLIAIPL